MSAGFLLAPVELVELTGAHRAALQLDWFQGHGIPAELGRDGRVKVLRAAVEAKMMPGQGRAKAKTEPNLYRKTG